MSAYPLSYLERYLLARKRKPAAYRIRSDQNPAVEDRRLIDAHKLAGEAD
jgi:hypothetical protein